MTKRTHDEFAARRELQDAGWKLDKTDKVEFNDGSETLSHFECKARVSWYLREQGYRVDSEVEGPDGQEADLVAYGLRDEPPFVVECETGVTDEVVEQKLNQHYYNTPFAEVYVLEARDMPPFATDAKAWLQEQLGGSL